MNEVFTEVGAVLLVMILHGQPSELYPTGKSYEIMLSFDTVELCEEWRPVVLGGVNPATVTTRCISIDQAIEFHDRSAAGPSALQSSGY